MTTYFLPSTVSSGKIATFRSWSLRFRLKMCSRFMEPEISKSSAKRIFSVSPPQPHQSTTHITLFFSPQPHQSTTNLTLCFSPSATSIRHTTYTLFLPLNRTSPPQTIHSVSAPQPHQSTTHLIHCFSLSAKLIHQTPYTLFLPLGHINPPHTLHYLSHLSHINSPHTFHSSLQFSFVFNNLGILKECNLRTNPFTLS
jgi:hypothetical protein